MSRYTVFVPFTGLASFDIEADSEEDAINEALNKDFSEDAMEEFSYHRKITNGNVFYGHQSSAWVELKETEED